MKKRKQTREVKYVKPAKQEIRQTKQAGGNFLETLYAYRDAHVNVFVSSLIRLADSPFNTIMTIAVLSIAIALAAGFQLVVSNMEALTANLENSTQFTIFLKDNVSDARAAKVAESFRQNPAILQVNVIGKDQALEEFKHYSGFGDAIGILKTNPLPVVLQVMPKNSLGDKNQLEELRQEFQQDENVDTVDMDMLWVERLQSIMGLVHSGLTMLKFVLLVSALFIAGNTIRLELHSRREEVIIAKLVGATNGFIQRPFIYSGFLMGFISGVIAWFIVTVMMFMMRQSVNELSELYGGDFHLVFFSFADTFCLVFASAALGMLASWSVLKYQLRHTIPE